MDMRGFNDSDKPEGIHNYFIMNMVEDIRALVTGLGEKRLAFFSKYSLSLTLFICHLRFTLIGHDWGGMVSWFFARFHPGTVHKIIKALLI